MPPGKAFSKRSSARVRALLSSVLHPSRQGPAMLSRWRLVTGRVSGRQDTQGVGLLGDCLTTDSDLGKGLGTLNVRNFSDSAWT
jgi:hypothetical protein